ncbi:MAG: FixH family protein [Candidatus Contendobacter sp.]|nr:FixH family protein [Candidatus Contendobacter sp.]MDG4557037.1 FixH family protein [Candidatus Contendobacter sp.]
MTELLLGLALGVGAIFLANLGLIRFARMSAKQAAATVALVTLGLYVPYGILRWPGGDVFALYLAIYLLMSLVCAMAFDARATGRGLHWGPAAIGGFFIVVAVVGAVFVAVAERGLSPALLRWLLPEAQTRHEVSSKFPGVVARDFHQKEALYNQYLQRMERQRQRGWQVRKGWLAEPVASKPTLFRVAARTRADEPLTGATVTGRFLRPSGSALDVAFTLTEQAPGVYEAALTLPAAGSWDLVLQIRQGDELHEISASTTVGDGKS